MKKKTVIYSLIVVCIISGVFLINQKNKNNKIATVKTSIATLGELKSYISTTATVKSKNSKEYYGLQSKIKKVNVSVGDNVKKGDILVSYEAVDLASPVSQAQLQYDNSVLQKSDLYNQSDEIKNKISDLDKEIKDLKGSSSPANVAKLETKKQQRSALSSISGEKLKQTDNAVKLAEIALISAKKVLADNKSTIVATNTGVVTALNALEGSIGNASQPIVVVQDVKSLKGVASLGKYDAIKVKIGQEVIVNTGNSTYKGKISFIQPAAKITVGATGSETTLDVEIDILDKSPDLKIDFDVDVDILVESVASAIKIPSESLKIEKGNKNSVYVVKDNIVHEVNVDIGTQSDTEVQITKGITKGEKIVLNPSTSIVDGTIIKEGAE
ncbi:MAG: efflux RND transporter periplasmic adaptor subunit [Clostridium sp.]|uniref:efflux RND transporter periplasmic adaptor subunit n=1 Tax=Clostridium sp. TaxID=1506 RepID=UPI003D6D0354